jgi:hypothetical protein
MTNPLLVKFVEELNKAVASVVVEHSDETISAYKEVGGKLPEASFAELMQNGESFVAMIHLLQSARAQFMAATRKPPEPTPRDLNWLASGAAKAVKAITLPETDESKARLAICESCDQWTGKSCKICGCFVKLKVKIPEEKCPAGKW